MPMYDSLERAQVPKQGTYPAEFLALTRSLRELAGDHRQARGTQWNLPLIRPLSLGSYKSYVPNIS
jgi:hypothetical protein